MARKPVRVPQGWDDKPPSSHGDVVTDDVKSKDDIKNEKSIGGTAEQS
jgi:cell division protease FtsH